MELGCNYIIIIVEPIDPITGLKNECEHIGYDWDSSTNEFFYRKWNKNNNCEYFEQSGVFLKKNRRPIGEKLYCKNCRFWCVPTENY